MAVVELIQDKILFEEGNIPIDSLLMIMKGSVLASFPGGEMILEKGDVIGICEVGKGTHFLTYKALEPSSAISYPADSVEELEKLFQSKKDLATLFTQSACKQILLLMRQYTLLTNDCNDLYLECIENYKKYKEICQTNHISPQAFPRLEEVRPVNVQMQKSRWISQYYEAFESSILEHMPSTFTDNPWLLTGILMNLSLDYYHIMSSMSELIEYQTSAADLYMNEEEMDLFSLFSSLYFHLDRNNEILPSLHADMNRMLFSISNFSFMNQDMIDKRTSDYEQRLANLSQATSDTSNVLEDSCVEELSASIDTILDYAELDHEQSALFKRCVKAYTELPDRNSSEDNVRQLSKELTSLFFTLYKSVTLKTFQDMNQLNIPIIIKMFLYYGYVDENLAGIENACALYHICEDYSHEDRSFVYPFYDWLCAIYAGQKEPSRNEFDEDYTDYVHGLKMNHQVSSEEAALLSKDMLKKVEYELTHMFASVNKITFGRISTYCPVFSEHNVIRDLSSVYVTDAKVQAAITAIKQIDFSAYYRETIYSNTAVGIPKETINVEFVPDVILMPNVGIRGSMWQEIEGKKRTTPARFMLPIFLLEDLTNTMIHLTGEFRWEMCKRIQGIRWNDVTEHSLTSDYSEYTQFYRKNSDLSAEAKDKIKLGLQKAKNSSKELFARDYVQWILYEGNGSPRLNKVARTIFFTYCPFSSAIRETLNTNPLYRELLDKYKVKTGQKLHHMHNVITKMQNAGVQIPPEIRAQSDYINY